MEANWLYTGIYRAGHTVYTDTIRMPALVTTTLSIDGGNLASQDGRIQLEFAPHTFTTTLTVAQIPLSTQMEQPVGTTLVTGLVYQLAAFEPSTSWYVTPSKPYTVTIQYTDQQIHGTLESTLGLYAWDGTQWVQEATSVVDLSKNTLTATPRDFTIWGILGSTRRVYLPTLAR